LLPGDQYGSYRLPRGVGDPRSESLPPRPYRSSWTSHDLRVCALCRILRKVLSGLSGMRFSPFFFPSRAQRPRYRHGKRRIFLALHQFRWVSARYNHDNLDGRSRRVQLQGQVLLNEQRKVGLLEVWDHREANFHRIASGRRSIETGNRTGGKVRLVHNRTIEHAALQHGGANWSSSRAAGRKLLAGVDCADQHGWSSGPRAYGN